MRNVSNEERQRLAMLSCLLTRAQDALQELADALLEEMGNE